jgi:hypothetical protein
MPEHKDHEAHMIVRGRATGAITAADIERRARELALIRRGDERYNEEDLRRAERELMGDTDLPDVDDDENTPYAANRDPSEPISNHGFQHVMPGQEGDEQTAPERLAQQGVDEAQHDQMVESRRRSPDVDVPDPERPGSKP